MNNHAKLFFKGQYIFNTAWRYCGETYGIMKKLDKQEIETIEQIRERFRLGKEMIEIINKSKREEKIKILNVYNNYFKPKKEGDE